MAKVLISLQVEYETNDDNSARASIIRIQGDLTHSIQSGAGTGLPTGVIRESVKVKVVSKTIDGKPA
jgi:hypothetical protein